MKKLTTLFLGGLLIGSFYAQAEDIQMSRVVDNDFNTFSLNMKSHDNLKVGINKLYAKVIKDSNVHSQYDVRLKLFTPDNTVVTYKSLKVMDTGVYPFSVDLKEKGQYGYVLTYSLRGGVTRVAKGRFEI